ncbi:MAG: SMI1/KNR4 family protein [Planctomycetota bacterium]|nr:SMI1/KNR4 family protein [Planctomycetaceae bacterium]MDQ3330485.1 SMI1/KNR4 family protein [Planctomycetota bacterium]
MSSELGQRLKARWIAEELQPRPGVSVDDLDAFETTHGIRLPDDLRNYLRIVNGTGKYSEMDQSYHCWWSLEEWKSVEEKWPREGLIDGANTTYLFADHSIECPTYGIRLAATNEANEIIAIFSDKRPFDVYVVADSFTELMERYLRNEMLH